MSLIKNTAWNLTGYIIPSIIAIPALGYLARSLGAERFGLFTLAVALIGYAGIFDAGLTRAVIREISLYKHEIIERNNIISTSSILLTLFGVLGGAIIYVFGPEIVILLKVDSALIQESEAAIALISISLPFFLLNQAWLGILEGEEKFKLINIVKTFNSSFIAGLPAVFIMFKANLIFAVTGLVFARLISLVITFYACRMYVIGAGVSFNKITAVRLLKYGGWITVSNIISPLMAYVDRFIVSHMLGASHVAYYTAPAEGVQRLSVFPGALSRAVFPKLSGLSDSKEKVKQQKLAYLLMVIAILPVCLIGGFFAEKIMTIWMGEEFSGLPALILKILLVGFFFNCIAQIPFANIQAMGRSKITAIIHLCEVTPYFLLLFLCINLYGVLGAAIAWSIRTTTDCFIMLIIDKNIKR